jgi:pimeloyl-ACP methyl ester carboxylesterase
MTTVQVHGDTALATEDLLIPSGDPGIELFLRNRRPAALTRFTPDRTLLFVHGGTQASEVTFDLELDGISWMSWIAQRGWDVWLVDIRGFGRSTRPPEMDLPAETVPPLVRTETAQRDFGAAVRYILERRDLSRLNALAWSWGTLISAGWAAKNRGLIGRLALFGPAWKVSPAAAGEPGPGYVTWTPGEAFERLQAGVPVEQRAVLTPPHWFKVWAEATVATDDQAHRYDPPRVRSPAGARSDIAEAAREGRTLYDAAAVTAATLVVAAEWDGLTPRAAALDLFDRLTGAPEKRYVEIGGATHFAHLERTRLQLFAAVQSFLES